MSKNNALGSWQDLIFVSIVFTFQRLFQLSPQGIMMRDIHLLISCGALLVLSKPNYMGKKRRL
jgi:hypothetical protein